MKYSIVYLSHTGNTKLLAESIRDCIDGECIYFGEPDEKALDADVIFAGFWTDKGTCGTELSSLMKKMVDKKVFIFGTAGFGGEQSYFDRLISNVSSNISIDNKIIGKFMCQGKMGIGIRKRYEGMLEKNPDDEGAKRSIENFDMAMNHPDKDDIDNLLSTVKSSLKSNE